MHVRRTAIATLTVIAALTACGGGDDDDSTTPAAPAGTGGEAATTTTRPQSGGGGGLGMGPEQFANQLRYALLADSAEVAEDGFTIVVTFSSGSTADGDAKCTTAATTVASNAAVRLVYPDGEVDC